MTGAKHLQPLDDQYVSMTQTRSEVMQARGYEQGMSQRAIAATVGVDHSTVSDDLRKVVGNTPPDADDAEAATAAPVEKPKRVVRKYDERYRTPRPRKVTPMPTLNGATTSPTAANVAPERLPTPATATNVAPSLVTVVQQLAAAGLSVSLQLDGVAVAVHA